MKHTTVTLLLALIHVARGQDGSDPLDIYRHYHACSICPTGEETSIIDALGVPKQSSNLPQDSVSCEEARKMAQMGRFSPAACLLLRLRIDGDCGCGCDDADDTVAATGPTNGTSPVVTTQPTVDIVSTLTSSSPPLSESSVVTMVSSVLLAPLLEGSLSGDQVVAFEGTLTNFLDDAVAGLENLKCKVTNQDVSSSRLVSAIEVFVSCEADSEVLSSEEFNKLAGETITDKSDHLLDDLRENPDFVSQVGTVVLNPTKEDVQDDDADERSNLGLVIVGATIGGGLLLIGGIFLIVIMSAMWSKRKASQNGPSTKHEDAIMLKIQSSTFEPEEATLVTGFSGSHNLARKSRTVVAPAGKLGIVIDTTLDGPVVHSVKPTSPLIGHVFPGDIVVSVNKEDTRAMSALALTALMARSVNGPRELCVLSRRNVVG